MTDKVCKRPHAMISKPRGLLVTDLTVRSIAFFPYDVPSIGIMSSRHLWFQLFNLSSAWRIAVINPMKLTATIVSAMMDSRDEEKAIVVMLCVAGKTRVKETGTTWSQVILQML
jgi:hypothetical protein